VTLSKKSPLCRRRQQWHRGVGTPKGSRPFLSPVPRRSWFFAVALSERRRNKNKPYSFKREREILIFKGNF